MTGDPGFRPLFASGELGGQMILDTLFGDVDKRRREAPVLIDQPIARAKDVARQNPP